MNKFNWVYIVQNKAVSVVGAGKWGSAIADLLVQNSVLSLYSRNSQKQTWHPNITMTNELSDVQQSNYIFIAIPAQQVGGFFAKIGKISPAAKIILCSKGIDISTGKLLSDIINDVLPGNKISIFSGPNFSGEVMNKVLTVSNISSQDLSVAQDIADSFSTDYFKFLPNNDIVATQVCGALKNVLAIACGVVRGLNMGENAVAAILTQGITEIMHVIDKFGGSSININSAAGVGDIFLSCNSATSRNNEFGAALANGHDIGADVVVEGKHTIIALSEHYYDMVKALPLLDFVHRLSTKQISGDNMIRSNLLRIFN